ncbi:MAG: MOFRL family protein, partial [Halobacteriales archaeon]|nr:MOFRL family protein [Halobacteriales archaeon]
AIDAARETARDRGSRVLVLTSCLRGEAREAGRFHAALAEECRATGQPVEPPVVLLSGGETTVTVRGSGRGGPNLECVLAAGIDLSAHGAAFAAVDTDGRDGGTPAAGGVVTAQTVDDVQAARRALDENDAFGYLADRDALIRTGATGTNVNDLRAVVVE